jgi:hypothetical protein
VIGATRSACGRRWAQASVVVAALLQAVRAAGAQVPRIPASVEARAEGLVVGQGGGAAGATVWLPAGPYARWGVGGSTGATLAAEGARWSSRAELAIRGLFDPFRESGRGLSIGAGVTVTDAVTGGWRPYVLLLVDVEGKRRGRFAPALQIAVGGGTRIGITLRTAALRAR